jgi:predicted small lipoprotein YifL
MARFQWLVLGLLLLGLTGCGIRLGLPAPGAAGYTREDAQDDDAYAKELLDDKGAIAEARQWLFSTSASEGQAASG